MSFDAHAAAALARAAEFIKGKPDAASVMEVFLEQCAVVYTAALEVRTQRAINEAEGTQLDNIGAIVKQPRDGRSDELYRPALRSRVLANRSSGTIEELYAIIRLLVPDATMVLREYPPASFILQVFDHTFDADEFSQLSAFFTGARDAGVNGVVQGMFGSRATTFTLDGTSAQSLDNGLLSGAEF